MEILFSCTFEAETAKVLAQALRTLAQQIDRGEVVSGHLQGQVQGEFIHLAGEKLAKARRGQT